MCFADGLPDATEEAAAACFGLVKVDVDVDALEARGLDLCALCEWDTSRLPFIFTRERFCRRVRRVLLLGAGGGVVSRRVTRAVPRRPVLEPAGLKFTDVAVELVRAREPDAEPEPCSVCSVTAELVLVRGAESAIDEGDTEHEDEEAEHDVDDEVDTVGATCAAVGVSCASAASPASAVENANFVSALGPLVQIASGCCVGVASPAVEAAAARAAVCGVAFGSGGGDAPFAQAALALAPGVAGEGGTGEEGVGVEEQLVERRCE